MPLVFRELPDGARQQGNDAEYTAERPVEMTVDL